MLYFPKKGHKKALLPLFYANKRVQKSLFYVSYPKTIINFYIYQHKQKHPAYFRKRGVLTSSN